ncbi:unnamed protein product [Mycena citricolor]|uniref:Uncharacterized protein n=1 Tax=Mycena citricolor TaxID=2018698 RepID=A0AAD2HVM7_9AGAR|nr:unnamed protein product [Mycena citricolor]CAK5282136.1 unnamed protein product [Mycena citricolor]
MPPTLEILTIIADGLRGVRLDFGVNVNFEDRYHLVRIELIRMTFALEKQRREWLPAERREVFRKEYSRCALMRISRDLSDWRQRRPSASFGGARARRAEAKRMFHQARDLRMQVEREVMDALWRQQQQQQLASRSSVETEHSSIPL